MKIYTPLEARKWFASKARINWLITTIVFSCLLVLLAQFNDWWLAALISAAGACCLFFFILDKRSIGIECPNCGRIVEANTPWECGFKGCRNENVSTFPFINECEHCQYIPKAYECHHCEKLIFLSPDKQRIHFAKCLVVPKSVAVKDVLGDKVVTQKEEVRDLEHKLRKTELEKKIEIEKNKPVVAEPKTTAEQALEDEIVKGVKQGVSLFELEKRLKAKADVDFAKNEHMREQAYGLIEREIFKRMT